MPHLGLADLLQYAPDGAEKPRRRTSFPDARIKCSGWVQRPHVKFEPDNLACRGAGLVIDAEPCCELSHQEETTPAVSIGSNPRVGTEKSLAKRRRNSQPVANLHPQRRVEPEIDTYIEPGACMPDHIRDEFGRE
jgi:hypothetical protein